MTDLIKRQSWFFYQVVGFHWCLYGKHLPSSKEGCLTVTRGRAGKPEPAVLSRACFQACFPGDPAASPIERKAFQLLLRFETQTRLLRAACFCTCLSGTAAMNVRVGALPGVEGIGNCAHTHVLNRAELGLLTYSPR